MVRRLTAVVAAVALAALAVAPADAAAKTKKAAPKTYYLNWAGDCSGSGYLSLKPVPNPDDCALFFPQLGDTHFFAGSEGMPFALDATKTIPVDFNLSTVASAAAEFEALLTATVGGAQVDVASATTSVQVAGPGATPVHFDLEPDPALHRAKVSSLTLTIRWTSGFTYSSMQVGTEGSRMIVSPSK